MRKQGRPKATWCMTVEKEAEDEGKNLRTQQEIESDGDSLLQPFIFQEIKGKNTA